MKSIFVKPNAAWLLLMLLFLFAAGCAATRSDAETPTSEPSGLSAVPDPSQPLPLNDSEPNRRIVIWAPEFMMPGDETPAQRLLGDATRQFEQANPDAEVELQVKAQSGPAAILPYLRGAQQAAPAILPDLILIRAADLWQIVDLDLVPPLEAETLSGWDFYPFALDAATYNGELYGVPFAVELMHMAAVPQGPAPATWDDLLAGQERYLIQGRSTESELNASLLSHYAAAGGDLDEAISPSADVLTRLFGFYQAGIEGGVLAEESMDLTDLNAVWRAYTAGAAPLADTRSGLLLSERDSLARTAYGPSLAADGPPVTLAGVWAFAVLTQDPVRRADALAYVATLLEPGTHGRWTEYAAVLPSTPAAVATWDDAQPYYLFLRELLDSEIAVLPGGREFQEFARRLQSAQQDILSGEKSVDEVVAELMLAP